MPVPKGYALDQPQSPKLPAGYVLDGPDQPPSVPQAPQVEMNKVEMPKAGGIMDTLSNVGNHLKNMVVAPYHAFADPPQTGAEQGIASSQLGQAGVGLYRMTAKPTVDAVGTAVDQAKKGNLYSNDEYDASGNYKPSTFSSAMDAIPVAGPWARNIETEAHQQGAIPALAGLATDMLAPKAIAKGAGAVAQIAGRGLQIASTTPDAAKLAASRELLKGEPGQLLQSALKPAISYGPNVAQTLQSSIPDVAAANPGLKGVSGFAQGADAAKDAAYQPYNNMIAPYRPAPGGVGPVRPGSIYGGPIGDSIEASVPPINRFESPARVGPPSDWTATRPNNPGGILQSTAARADLYRRDIPIATADTLREDANAKLNAFYNKQGGDQNAALSNPETAAVKAIGDQTRAQLYPKLEADNGLQPGAVQDMQQKYGRLADVSDIANTREPVFARHDPVSLSQQIVMGHGGPISRLTNFAAQRMFKGLTDSDAQVNVAVDRYMNPSGPNFPAQAGVIPQMGSELGRGLYGTGKAVRSAPLAANPLFYSAIHPPKR